MMTLNTLLRERRVGRVIFSFDLINTLEWNELKAITTRIFAVQTEQSLMDRTITMLCVSPDFRAIEEGESTPMYQMAVRINPPKTPKGKPKYFVSMQEVSE